MDKFTCDDLQIIKGKYFCYRDLCRKDCTKESCEKWIINQIKQEHKRSIKIHGEFPDVKVIGLSMFEEKEIADAIRSAGAVNCLTKSGSPKEIIDAIRACCMK